MRDDRLRRRDVLGSLLALAGLPGSAAAQNAAAPAGFSTVVADVGPLRAKGLGPFAEAVRAALQAELAAAFGDVMRPGAPRLVVRIDAISMASYVGADTRRFGIGGGVSNDYLEGEALVIGPRGQVLRRHPQLSVVPSNSGGAWYLEESERRRVVMLARHYAGWLRRALP